MTSNGWVTLKNNHGTIGTVWIQDEGLAFAGDPAPGAQDSAERVFALVAASNELGVAPEVSITTVVKSVQKFDPLIKVEDGGESEALVAAATAAAEFVYEEKTPFSITVDTDLNVLGLIWIDETGNVSVRADEDWDIPEPDDERFYENAFYFVSQNAVQLFDKLVQDGNKPVLDDFNGVLVD